MCAAASDANPSFGTIEQTCGWFCMLQKSFLTKANRTNSFGYENSQSNLIASIYYIFTIYLLYMLSVFGIS